LNDPRHDQEPECAQTRRQSDDEQNRQQDLGDTVEQRHGLRRGKVIFVSEDVQFELILEQEDSGRGQRQESVELCQS